VAEHPAETTLNTDVLIIGAGPVGMTLALALADSPLRVTLIDRRSRGAWADDPRALALAYGSRRSARPGTGVRQPATAGTAAGVECIRRYGDT